MWMHSSTEDSTATEYNTQPHHGAYIQQLYVIIVHESRFGCLLFVVYCYVMFLCQFVGLDLLFGLEFIHPFGTEFGQANNGSSYRVELLN